MSYTYDGCDYTVVNDGPGVWLWRVYDGTSSGATIIDRGRYSGSEDGAKRAARDAIDRWRQTNP